MVVLFKANFFFFIIFFITFIKIFNLNYLVAYFFSTEFKNQTFKSFYLYAYRQNVKKRLLNELTFTLFKKSSVLHTLYLNTRFILYFVKFFKIFLNYILISLKKCFIFVNRFFFIRSYFFFKIIIS